MPSVFGAALSTGATPRTIGSGCCSARLIRSRERFRSWASSGAEKTTETRRPPASAFMALTMTRKDNDWSGSVRDLTKIAARQVSLTGVAADALGGILPRRGAAERQAVSRLYLTRVLVSLFYVPLTSCPRVIVSERGGCRMSQTSYAGSRNNQAARLANLRLHPSAAVHHRPSKI
jgi:hypothetical protein